MKRGGKFDQGVLLLVLIAVILFATGMFLYTQIRTDKVSELLKKGETLKVALYVADGDKLLFTEVFVFNPTTDRAAIFDIPGNVGSLIESLKRIDRIDVLYKRSDPSAYQSAVGGLLGTEIPFALQIDIRDLPKLVDLLGGLKLFISNAVWQVGKTPMTLLPSGDLVLEGSKVRDYLTYRDPADTDIEVVDRQQRFVQALFKAIGANASMLGNPEVFPYLRLYLSTDMNRRSLVTFIDAMAKLDTDRMVFQRVLGVKRTVDSKELLFPHYGGRLLQQTWSQTLDTLASAESASNQQLVARIQILNGTLVPGLARRTSEIYESFGYIVAATGNADRQDYEKTLVIDRRGDMAQAQRIASVIRCTRVETQTGTTGGQTPGIDPFDVTIVIGKDFDGRYVN